MEATHVRFALDLSERLGILDAAAFCAGAVYPDSRYVTGVPREATHDDRCPHDPFAPGLTEFERGWATHLLYDRGAAAVKRAALAGFAEGARGDDWAFHTAIKLVEDRESIRVLGPSLGLLRAIELRACPRGEDEETMRRYYRDLREAYAGTGAFDQYRATLAKWGVATARVERMIGLAEAFSNDPSACQTILEIYSIVMERYVHDATH